MVWTVLTLVNQLEFAALFVLCFLVGMVCGEVESVSLHAARGRRRTAIWWSSLSMRFRCRGRPRAMSARSMRQRGLGDVCGQSSGATISPMASAAASAGGASLAHSHGDRGSDGSAWASRRVCCSTICTIRRRSWPRVKAAATVPAHHVVPGVTLPANAQVIMPCAAPFPCGGYDAILNIPGTAPPGTSGCVTSVPVMPAGWWVWGSNPQGDGGCMIGHLTGQANAPVTVPATTGTPTEVAAVLQNLPASDPLSIESNTVPAGVGVASTPADQVVSQPVPASQVTPRSSRPHRSDRPMSW